MYADQFEIYSGNANPDLARKICRYLGTEQGRLFLGYFLLAEQKKVTRPPGRDPAKALANPNPPIP